MPADSQERHDSLPNPGFGLGCHEGDFQYGVFMISRFSFLGLAALICACLVACGRATDPGPMIAIQSTSPPGERLLLEGEDIEFQVAVLARNAPLESSFGLVIQAADGTPLGVAGPAKFQSGLEGKLSAKVHIPRTASVEVFVALYGDPNAQSIAVDSRNYRVFGALAK